MLPVGWDSSALPPPVPFFIYNDEILLHGLMGHCMKRQTQSLDKHGRWTTTAVDLVYNESIGAVHEFSASKYFVRMMMSHPWRSWDPEEAEVFIIPIDLNPSAVESNDTTMCGPQMYEEHLLQTLAVVCDSPHFRKSNGADHFWMMSANNPERNIEKWAPALVQILRRWSLFHFLTVGVMERFPGRTLRAKPLEKNLYVLEGELRRRPWRCSLPIPYVQSFPFSQHDVDDFQVWLKRKYVFYHQFSGYYQDEYSKNLRTQALKIPFVSRRPSRAWVSDRFVTSRELQLGFQSSRFCFAIAGRHYGSTRKFFDAVVHNCIPVVICDQWLYAFAPFSGHINHESYAVFVPEELWLKNFSAVIRRLEAMPLRELASRYQALLEVFPLLSYDRKESHALGSVLLWELLLRCGTKKEGLRDEASFPVGVKLPRVQPASTLNGSQVAEELFRNATALSWKWRQSPAATSQFLG